MFIPKNAASEISDSLAEEMAPSPEADGSPEAPADDSGEIPTESEALADSMMQAFEAKDRKAFAEALKSFIQYCESEE